jgi:hypothetical protein
MEKTQVTAEWLIEKGFEQLKHPDYRFVFKDVIMYDLDDFTFGTGCGWDATWFPNKKQYTHEVEELIFVLMGERI